MLPIPEIYTHKGSFEKDEDMQGIDRRPLVLLLHTPDSRLQGRLQARGFPMCFHIGPEFVEALTSREVAKSAVDTSPVISDGAHPGEGQEHLTTFEHLASRLRAFLLAGVTIKGFLIILWMCF
jgi:hypothetical protein